jgi:GNAT superfamily N-acetyltransferase
MKIVQITDDRHQVIEPDWLARAEQVHRQLRPQVPADYSAQMRKIFQGGGEMCVCTDSGGNGVLGLAVYRAFENTFTGCRFYVDDLVTDETRRSQGVGHKLMQFLENEAKRRGANYLELESGTQRTQAHKFYFREGMTISSFSFRKALR